MSQNTVARYEVTQFVKGFRLLWTPQLWMVLVILYIGSVIAARFGTKQATVFTKPRKLLASLAVLGGCICLIACIRFLSGDIPCAEMWNPQ